MNGLQQVVGAAAGSAIISVFLVFVLIFASVSRFETKRANSPWPPKVRGIQDLVFGVAVISASCFTVVAFRGNSSWFYYWTYNLVDPTIATAITAVVFFLLILAVDTIIAHLLWWRKADEHNRARRAKQQAKP